MVSLQPFFANSKLATNVSLRPQELTVTKPSFLTVCGVLRLRSALFIFARSFDLNSPPSVRMPSRSVIYWDELTSVSSTRCNILIKSAMSCHSYLRYSSFSRLCSFLARKIHHLFSSLISEKLIKKRVLSRDTLNVRTNHWLAHRLGQNLSARKRTDAF